MKYKVGIISLGCAKNRVDAEMLLAKLNKKDYEIVEDVAMSDAAIINTCAFIEPAKQESIEEILELAKLKKEGRIKCLIVTGCLAERYQREVMEQLPEVDACVGLGSNDKIAEIIKEALKGKKVEIFPPKEQLALEGKRIQSTPTYYAYLKIAEGCDNHCTYCAIPMIRGKYRSRTIENLVKEAQWLADGGVRELILIAQDTSYYGNDIYGKPMLPKLLRELCKIEKIRWIRVLYCYPERITDELIEVIADEDKIVKYLDLPLQHCSAEVLKRMNRKGSTEYLTSLLHKIRERIPNITLRSTFITGFPGESEEQFEELSQFVKDMKFQRMGCFPYSQEENTPAAKLPDQIDEDTKLKRAEIISEQQQLIMENYAEQMIGKEVEVLVEGFDRYAECWFGRTAGDCPEVDGNIFFTAFGEKPREGTFVKVKITDSLGIDPVGEVIKN
ncbi:MAG: 30S ribosomal protein S12 methylthiotransferase RimO [Ruminococcus sp.]|nr:30S ribosomal protein S12 methylthiotransferase RimO [Ruminococcus sp.]